MIYYAFIFLVDALFAGALALAGVSAVFSRVALILLLIGMILLLLHLVTGRRDISRGVDAFDEA
jgi:uncharacterized membrane protein YtjA (UPF0391 family)